MPVETLGLIVLFASLALAAGAFGGFVTGYRQAKNESAVKIQSLRNNIDRLLSIEAKTPLPPLIHMTESGTSFRTEARTAEQLLNALDTMRVGELVTLTWRDDFLTERQIRIIR